MADRPAFLGHRRLRTRVGVHRLQQRRPQLIRSGGLVVAQHRPVRRVPREVVGERRGRAEHGDQPVPHRAADPDGLQQVRGVSAGHQRVVRVEPVHRPQRLHHAHQSAQCQVGVGRLGQVEQQVVLEDVVERVDEPGQHRVGQQPHGAFGVAEAQPGQPATDARRT